MRHLLKMGSFFLVGLNLLFAKVYAEDIILLPENPKPAAVPHRGEKGAEEDYQMKKEYLDKTLEKEKGPVKSPTEIRDRKLLEETLKPRPLMFSVSTALLIPYVQVSGPRKKYSSDFSSAIYTLFRPNKNKEISKFQFFYGFRGAFLNGSGTYKNSSGRFSLLYFGPIVGMGKIGLARKSLSSDAIKDAESVENALESQQGYFLLTGISGQSRFTKIESGYEEPDDDLNPKSVAFDSPGLWCEAHYTSIHYGAVAVNLLAGIQLGHGKTFYYVGVGAGGWY